MNAIKTKDMEEAKRVKAEKSNIENYRTMVSSLELRKMQAIENEDYDQAKMVKAELENLKREMMSGKALEGMGSRSASGHSSL